MNSLPKLTGFLLCDERPCYNFHKNYSLLVKFNDPTSEATEFNLEALKGLSFHTLHSCNGLILIMVFDRNRPPTEPFDLHQFLAVINPATGVVDFLEKQAPQQPHALSHVLAFDANPTGDYKVVQVSSFNKGLEFHVYSSSERAWSAGHVIRVGHCYDMVDFAFPVYVKGKVFWHCKLTGTGGLLYDVAKDAIQEFAAIPIDVPNNPALPDEKLTNRYFGTSGGKIHFIHMNPDKSFQLWELKDDLSSWFVKHDVQVQGIPPKVEPVSIIFVATEDDDSNNDSVFLQVAGSIISYNFKSKEKKGLWTVPGEVHRCHAFRPMFL